MRPLLYGMRCLLCLYLLLYPHGNSHSTPHAGQSLPLLSQSLSTPHRQANAPLTPHVQPTRTSRHPSCAASTPTISQPHWMTTVAQRIVRVKATGHLPCSSHGDIVWPHESGCGLPLTPTNALVSTSTPWTQPLTRHGTGFSVPHERYGGRLILSNYHVVMPALTPHGRVWVQVFSGSWISARVVHTEASADLAWVLLPASITVPPLQWAPSSWATSSGTGQKVCGLTMHQWPHNTVYVTGRLINAACPVPENKGGKVPSFVQTSLPIQPGYSGGPLLNTKGQVIGVCSFGYTPENQSRWTMAIPAAVVRKLSVRLPIHSL